MFVVFINLSGFFFLPQATHQRIQGPYSLKNRTSPFPAEYLVEINKILLAVADAELLLNAPELHAGIYEDFSTQEDSLKVLGLQHALD